ncbi:uncharacterized protein LOC123557003 isoform X4 [Mercenaria mercenaria]|uniref:uncharacterized protein LOC123557003 isoform X4 n=1 Tax=Mercenaria mercenaria TaxID=6596 RepID=UPI00234E5F0D|nr:uncharacterized protein LOC123557003 isoform X4 [Mercenaria mercenaria]
MSALEKNTLKCLNSALPEGWEAKLVSDEGRIYYLDHKTQSSSWLPPRENWDPGSMGLPYGWEGANDRNKKPYFINHVENFTSRDDPRDDPDYIEPPKPREVELVRDSQKGFGFVAGSEKPVVVRFVTEGGPSVDKLLPGDQIIKINGQDVKKAPREFVIDLVRSCKQSITLSVCQPYNDNSSRKSALLTAAKKDRLKKNPSRVRFAEEIIVNGASVPSNSPEESYVPFMPNVLKVFLENGQTKSFKYDNKTTVKDVVNSLQEKLNIKCIHHFNLVLHNMKSHMPGHMTLLQDHETVSEIASRPGSRHFRCLFRVAYVPKDSYDLLKQDPIAFEYFYMQCVNDVLQDRFASELKTDTLLRLAALHIQQHAMSNNMTGKINIKTVEKEFGFEKFVSQSIRENMKVKDLRKILAQCLKMNQNLTAPGQKQLTALQAKLHYMKIVSELKTFGSRVFMVTLLDKKTEAMVLVGPKSGVSLVTNIRFYTGLHSESELSMLADFSEIQCIKVAKDKDNMHRVELSVKGDEPGLTEVLKNLIQNNNNDKQKTLNLGLLKDDAMNFVSMVNGYYKIFVDPNGSLVQKNAGGQSNDPDIPPYESKHTVFAAPWSYPEDIVSMTIDDGDNQGEEGENERVVDLSRGPPAYEGNKEFISKLKQDLGIKSEQKAKEADTSDDIKQKTTPPDKKQTNKVVSPVKEPMKTVIKIESPRPSEAVHRPDKKDSESISSDTSSSMTSDTDSSPVESKRKPAYIPQDRSRQRPAADEETEIANSERFKIDSQKMNGQYSRNYNPEYVEYMNTGKNRKLDIGGNSSDTDSGVGGEGDRTLSSVQDSIQGQGRSNGKEEEPDDWDTPPGTPTDVLQPGSRLELARNTELQLDLSSLIDPSYNSATAPESPSSSASLPDVDSSFVGPFDPDQLPLEIQNAVYDPRMFAKHEIYLDPDIIDLTLLPPFPPTEEELSSSQQQNSHPRLLRMATVSGDVSPGASSLQRYPRSPVQKSVSVGYCPDFLDNDIDAIIDKLTVQPPPTAESKESQEPADPDKLGNSWNGPIREEENGGMDFENVALSKTIDLGSLALEEQYSSLVIPPPPVESFAVQDILIVPPVESVKEKRKMFEKSDSKGYLQSFGKQTVTEGALTSAVTVDKKGASVSKEDKNNAISNDDEVNVDTNSTQNDSSPASVSEKLNALLKSLSSCNEEEEEALGHFRRTSSLRLGRSSSMDVLNTVQNMETNKNSDLVIGSVRVKPKLRPKLSIERPAQRGHVPIPLKTASLERVESTKTEECVSNSNFDNTNNLKFQRTHSCDVLPTNKNDKSLSDGENSVSESFASLKAKLQSYRDSLLNRSLRRKKKMTANNEDADRVSLDGDLGERKSPLTRSNSFSSLIRRSLGRAAGREFQKAAEGRSSSATRAGSSSGSDDKTDSKDSHVMKDKKYWNTLTTPRSNFRPNTGTSQAQDDFFLDLSEEMESFAPKPPLPSTVSSTDKGETKKQKSGPIKALSSVFDAPKTEETNSLSVPSSHKREKSPKRMAPQAPTPSVQTSVATSMTSSSVTSSKISTRSNVQTLASGLTKPLTIPTAPPRRKNGQGERTKSPVLEQKSKDDSEINTESSSKSNVKTSPFATVGKMWRPMSMTSSASTNQDETYQSYNNFDVLRDMTSERLQTPVNAKVSKVNGHVIGKGIPASSSSSTAKGKPSTITKDGKTVSEKSFALLREKVSANHSNMVKQVLDTVYTSEDFVQATNDVDRLLNELKQTMESLKSSRIDRKPLQFNMCKDELQTQVRQFVTDAKLLVSNATQTKAKLAVNMDSSMHSLAKIFLHGQATMFMMEAIHQAQHLGSEVIRVANAYKSTLNAAHAAVGKPLADPHMKYLMRQATNLASLLSTLLKSLKTLEQK